MKKTLHNAFTMLELVFVIVVAGILAAVIIPRTESTSLQEAAIQLVSHIRYTQHLAMVDDKFDSTNPNWYKQRWQLFVAMSADTNNQPAYTIFSDSGTQAATNPDKIEMAIDPLDSSKYLSGGYSGVLKTSDSDANKKMNLGASYGITGIVFGGGCTVGGDNERISFDHLGRPIIGTLLGYTSAYQNAGGIGLITQTCTLTLLHPDGNATILIEPETGYTHIQ